MEGEEVFRSPSLAVDAISLRDGENGLQVLLITRGFPPWQGRLAFPGGFVDIGEDPERAVIRELYEETGVEGRDPVMFAVRGDPDRDPRKHIVSIFYLVKVDADANPLAGDDASHAEWIDLSELRSEEVAGDHFSIIEQLRK